ncbi:Fic family protein [Candidatus Poriferisodalis sp.]|uniref:Fic family protein n=1 Tax=Candidatus Poriferisodalis sp. TaxID=3101277 RepID=UPI003AF84BED
MPAPNEKLAASMEQLQSVQGERRVLRSAELSRTHRDRLVRSGLLRRATKGWLFVTNPADSPDNATGWYACFWEFCASLCEHRFGDSWHLSSEASILQHAGVDAIPTQVVVCSRLAGNHAVQLPHGTSLLDLRLKEEVNPDDVTVNEDGLRVLTPSAALIGSSAHSFKTQRIAVTTVLARMDDHRYLLGRLLDGAHTTIAGRLAGSFRSIGREDVADDVIRGMRSAGFDVRETCPWEYTTTVGLHTPVGHPAAIRIRIMWESLRDVVIAIMPQASGPPTNTSAYLSAVDDQYRLDAYHSLSIEGYRVSTELIERVRMGTWSPRSNPGDSSDRDAMAARGYWQAFQQVRDTVEEVLSGANSARLVRDRHQDWYRELFGPSVDVGLVTPSDLSGYRRHPTYLRGSRHVPMRWEGVPSAMKELFELMDEDEEPAVRAVLGHFLFGFIHPYADGNGRMARFIMNTMLASGGYPWTAIRVADRKMYMDSLEAASLDQMIEPFAEFIAARIAATPTGR